MDFKKYILKSSILKDILMVLIAFLIGLLVNIAIYFINKDINDFKKDIISNLEKYGVTDVTISSMYKDDESNKYVYNVVVQGNSDKITEKSIYEYIEYMEDVYFKEKTSDYEKKHNNYYYPKNLIVKINNVSYDRKAYDNNCLNIIDDNGEYTLNVDTGEKKVINNNNFDNDSNKNTYAKPTNSEARFMAENICESYLKSPSSAKWGKSANVTSLGNDKYSVVGSVESKNSFGAMVSATYYAYFTFTGSGYENGYCSITNN